MTSDPYIHGYSEIEQQRLLEQAEFLSPWVLSTIPWDSPEVLYEPGCGVGAQTRLLLKKFPQAKIIGIDRDERQLHAASVNLQEFGDRVQLQKGDILKSSIPDESVDGAYVCWVLEHLNKPDLVLQDIYRVLKPGGSVLVTEVFTTSFRIWPMAPLTQQFFRAMCDLQDRDGGDANIGFRLGTLLDSEGFTAVEKRHIEFAWPNDTANKKDFFAYWWDLLASGYDSLIANAYKGPVLDQVKQEWDSIVRQDHVQFTTIAYQWLATKPVRN